MRKIILIVLALLQACFASLAEETKEVKQVDFKWGKWSEKTVDEARTADKPVFVEFYADWCLTCRINRKKCFQDEKVTAFLKAEKIVPLRADFTNQNETTAKALRELNRTTVPTYVLYVPGKKDALILPDLLSPENFIRLSNQVLRAKSIQKSQGSADKATTAPAPESKSKGKNEP